MEGDQAKHFRERERVKGYKYGGRKRAMQLLFASFGRVTETSIVEAANAPDAEGSIWWCKSWALHYNRSIKYAVAGYFKQNLYSLALLTGGVKKFLAIPKKSRAELYRTLFRKNVLAICRHAFKHESQAVNMEGIFASTKTKLQRKWQKVYKYKFLRMCELVEKHFLPWAHRIEYWPKEQRDALGLYQKRIMTMPNIYEIDLGSIEQLPSRPVR